MKAYISCPMSEPFELVLSVEEILKEKGYSVDYWKRKEKYNKRMSNYDIFVLIPGDNRFDLNNRHGDLDLSIGCSKEYDDFYNHMIDDFDLDDLEPRMFLAYKNAARLQIYELDFDDFKAIPGTNIKSILEHANVAKKDKIFDACY